MAELFPSSEKDPTELDCANSGEPPPVSDSLPSEPESAEDSPSCRFFLEGRCRFGALCRNYHPGDAHHFEEPKLTVEPLSQLCQSKKPAMKTAEDVISRLLWDTQVPAEHFSIGYLDRFLGVVEQPFNAFSWTDLASAGPSVLAIPKHRIQYFKYRDCIVWDKTNRTDDIFGSTGSGRTILEVIKKEEKVAHQAIKAESDSHRSSGDEEKERATAGQEMTQYDEQEDASNSDGLSRLTAQVDIAKEAMHNLNLVGDEVSILNENGESTERAKEAGNRLSTAGNVIEHSSTPEDEPRMEESAALESICLSQPKCHPTHFVAISVTNPEIRKAVALFQEALCAVRPDLAKFCVPLASLHITLVLLHLSTSEDIYNAVTALQELEANARHLLPPALVLSFCGVETFNSRVLYMAPASISELSLLAQTLEDAFSKKSLTVIQSPQKGNFHLSIVKIPPSKTKLQLPTDSSWIPTIKDLGTQVVEALCLRDLRCRRSSNILAEFSHIIYFN